MERIYLDYAATTPVAEEVMQAMLESSKHAWANASAQYTSGRLARKELENSRLKIAETLGLNPKGIIFTSGASEANNFLIKANAYRLRISGKGSHLLTSIAEHPSVYEVFQELEKDGFTVTYLGLNENGSIDLNELKNAVREDTSLVSIMTVNNETGVIMPVQEIAKFLHDKNIFFHTDYVQALGKIKILPADFNPDALSLSAHKIYGPKGIGIAYQNPDIPLKAMILGGHQEFDKRAGTESVVLATGFAKAVELMEKNKTKNLLRLEELSEYLYKILDKSGIEYLKNTSAESFKGIQNIWFKGKMASQVLVFLDLNGIEISAGSACAAGALEDSRVLQAMFGAKSPRLSESLRISFGPETSEAEITRLVEVLKLMK